MPHLYILLDLANATYVVIGLYFCVIGYRIGIKNDVSAALSRERDMLAAYPELGQDYAQHLGWYGFMAMAAGTLGMIIGFYETRLAIISVGPMIVANHLRYTARRSLKKRFNSKRRKENASSDEFSALAIQRSSNPQRPLAMLLLCIGAWFAVAALIVAMLIDAGIRNGAPIFAAVCGLLAMGAIGWGIALVREKAPKHDLRPDVSP